MAQPGWPRQPRDATGRPYVLLAGDGTYDPRGFLGPGGPQRNQLPINPYDTATAEAASDTNLTGTLTTGRLPARTSDAMSALVAKTLAYEDRDPTRDATLVSDVGDTADFRRANADVAAQLPAGWATTQIDRGTQADARRGLLAALGAGPALVNYAGHGSVDLWRGDLLTDTDAADLANTGRPSFYVIMTCLNGYFTDPRLDGLAEALLAAPGGAAAVFSSTSSTPSAGQTGPNQQFVNALTHGPTRAGDAAATALQATFDPDVRATWTLLGDPTLLTPAG